MPAHKRPEQVAIGSHLVLPSGARPSTLTQPCDGLSDVWRKGFGYRKPRGELAT